MKIIVLRNSWRFHPLAWLHRAEARTVAAELSHAGHEVKLMRFTGAAVAYPSVDALLLRLSDPSMRDAAQALNRFGVPYLGPRAEVLERCYDKHEAYRLAAASGIDCPRTALGREPEGIGLPWIIKPRRGSDSIGIKIWHGKSLPARFRNDHCLVQQHVRGAELTVAVFRHLVGAPLRILLPEGVPYSFSRKYFRRPGRGQVACLPFAARVRDFALKIAALFGVDWAARIDLIHDRVSGRLYFLECDAAPLVGAQSAFAASFQAAGIERAQQLQMLVTQVPAS